jgi:hypothetical protein
VEPTYNFQVLDPLLLSFLSAVIRIQKEIETMSKQKRFSTLALAATGLLAASVTCFAQTDTAKSQNESTSVVAVASSNQPKVDERIDNYGVSAKTNENVSVTETKKNFSPEKFMTAVRQSSNSKSTFVMAPTYELRKDEFAKSVEPKRIEFVPSTGQKLPE